MEGIISNFRSAKHAKKDYQMIVHVAGVASREAALKLIKKQVEWQTPGNKVIKGTVTNLHGNKGAVRVQFERGMPGQSIGTKVKVI